MCGTKFHHERENQRKKEEVHKEASKVEQRVSGNSVYMSVAGMVVVGFLTIMLGIAICLVELRLGGAIAMIGLTMLAGSAIVAGAAAMSKQEELTDREGIDWGVYANCRTSSRSPIDLLSIASAITAFPKRAALTIIGKTVEERRLNGLAALMLVIIMVVGYFLARR